MRTIDPEHNWFWKEGYKDGLKGLAPIVPDEARHQFQRSDYFVGYDAGCDDRINGTEAEIGECPDDWQERDSYGSWVDAIDELRKRHEAKRD